MQMFAVTDSALLLQEQGTRLAVHAVASAGPTAPIQLVCCCAGARAPSWLCWTALQAPAWMPACLAPACSSCTLCGSSCGRSRR